MNVKLKKVLSGLIVFVGLGGLTILFLFKAQPQSILSNILIFLFQPISFFLVSLVAGGVIGFVGYESRGLIAGIISFIFITLIFVGISYVIIAPVIIFGIGIVEAFVLLSRDGRARRVILVLSCLGLTLYVGGFVIGIIGDYTYPGVDALDWGPMGCAAALMMLIGFVGAFIMLPVEILTAIFCRTKKEPVNQALKPTAYT